MSLSPGAKAALGLWVAALTWDAFCPAGQTISEAVERGLNDKRTEPIVTLLIMVTVAHLMRMLDDKYDVYSISFKAIGRVIERMTWPPRL
jgi:hypothetical protein